MFLSHFISRPCALRRSAPFRDCGGYSRWEQQLDGCRRFRATLRSVEHLSGRRENSSRSSGVGFSAQELDSCSVRRRSGFPRGSGAASAFQMHDGFERLSGLADAPTLAPRSGCRAATDHRINIAHLVLHPTWNCELSSGKESQKDKHRARLARTPGQNIISSLHTKWVFLDPEFFKCIADFHFSTINFAILLLSRVNGGPVRGGA